MIMDLPKGVFITPLKRIHHSKGDIFHALKCSEESFSSFGEAYFSTINKGDIKGWKKHKKMEMNLIVPVGEVAFHFFQNDKSTFVKAGTDNYIRITIKPDTWMAFQGVGEGINLVLNIASIQHDPLESQNADIDSFPITSI